MNHQHIINTALWYVEKYIKQHPNDIITIASGTAAYLHLSECNIEIEVHDIDVNITTELSSRTVMDHWLAILPDSYAVEYDTYYPGIITLVDNNGNGLSIDVFVNDAFCYASDIILHSLLGKSE